MSCLADALAHVRVGVQRQPHRAVADRVDVRVEARLGDRRHERVQLRGREVDRTAGRAGDPAGRFGRAGVDQVGLQEAGGLRRHLLHAVHEQLGVAQGDRRPPPDRALVVATLHPAQALDDLARVLARLDVDHRGEVRARGQPTPTLDRGERGQRGRARGGVEERGDALPAHRVQRGAGAVHVLGGGGCGNDVIDEVLRGVVEQAGRVAGGVTPDLPARGVGGRGGDLRERERARVHDRGVAEARLDDDRPLGAQRVEILLGDLGARRGSSPPGTS